MKLFGKKECVLYTPVKGEVIAITDVDDPVFSSKVMGDGFAVKPEDTAVYSPVEGTVTSVFPTKHAISIKSKSGIEILVHIGIDTVELKGEGFTINVAENQKVTPETVLADVDFNYLVENGKASDVMVILTNAEGKELHTTTGTYSAKEKIGSLKL